MKNPLEKAIFQTLAYADIFDYPLKEEEIWQWLISKFPASWRTKFKISLEKISQSPSIDHAQGYYFLAGRKKIVALRQKRGRWSIKKFQQAQKAAKILKIIPTIKMVGVTGNLAVGNCKEDDDIDLLVIASSGTLWLTRFLATLLLEIAGQRRRPGEKNVQDKICLNMFLEEKYLQIPKREQDLYTAHEVAQLKPLWDKESTYQNFLVDNLWIKDYLPNGIDIRIPRDDNIKKKGNLPNIFERLAKYFQLWYMRKRRTNEVIASGLIRFHPHDARKWILASYQRRIKNLPLDK